ncbi:tRNA(m(1)G37)methyltransferase [Massospora cicadina]|nr:tRNA(m(1)G37)methyltransferase [Massospora cicadina]
MTSVPKRRRFAGERSDKLILLKMGVTEDDLSTLSPTTRELITEFGRGFVRKELAMPYDHWSAGTPAKCLRLPVRDDVLRSILPDELPPPSSFTTVGHIAHLNLREEYLPYKGIIGEVILDKNPSIRTVVNKLDKIDTTFRNFQMEVLSGEHKFVTTVRENECSFQLDFSKVYWNSRLHTEHERIINLFEPGDLVCDVFAGVGPFALPAAKRGCRVYANDLNPASYHYLVQNLAANKINPPTGPPKVLPYNLDGRDFLLRAFNDLIAEQPEGATPLRTFDHVVMNLPANALEFLARIEKAPTVHVHCFAKVSDDPLPEILGRASQALGREIATEGDEASLRFVRRVAPQKDMFCLTFNLSLDDLRIYLGAHRVSFKALVDTEMAVNLSLELAHQLKMDLDSTCKVRHPVPYQVDNFKSRKYFSAMYDLLKDAPATFQRMIADVHRNLHIICFIAYVDDILIHSPTLEQYAIDLEAMIAALHKAGLK